MFGHFFFFVLVSTLVFLSSSNEANAFPTNNVPGIIDLKLTKETELKINAIETGKYNFLFKPLKAERYDKNISEQVKIQHFRVTLRDEKSKILFKGVLNPKSLLTSMIPTPDHFSLDLKASVYFLQLDPIYKDSRNQRLMIEVTCTTKPFTLMGLRLPVIAFLTGLIALPFILFNIYSFIKKLSESALDTSYTEDIYNPGVEGELDKKHLSENPSNFCPKCGLPRENGKDMCSECFSYYED